MKPVEIAIVGGGASGTLALTNLLREELAGPVHVTLYDGTGRFGRGVAYSTNEPRHLLNVRAAGMSGLQDDLMHFTRWAAEKGYGPRDFVPRPFYGAYLEELLYGTINAAEGAGHRITLSQAAVQGIKNNGDAFNLATDKGEKTARFVIWAAGNDKPVRPEGDLADGYHDSPWAVDYGTLGNEPVCILGTGLSMVDAVISLNEAGYKGKITALSRHALLPAPHTDEETPDFLINLRKNALPRTAREATALVRAHVEDAQRQGYSWHAAINGLRAVTNDVWKNLPPPEQKRLRRVLPYWGVLRHRMAPVPAALVSDMIASGRLTIEKDTVQHLEKDKTGFLIQGRKKQWQAGHVINCLGYGCAPPPLPVDTPGFYAIGPALCGLLLETTAVPEIRRTAHDLAVELKEKIRVILN